jgi:hypothetical protein
MTPNDLKAIRETELLFCEIACFDPDGKWAGWWDTQGRTDAKALGDELVESGTWRRHPEGVGRRWWYQPAESEASDG